MVVLRTALAGVAGWVLRLVFAASVGGGIVGVYIGLFASLGQRDPVHDRLAGLAVSGISLAVSVLAFALLRLALPGRTRTTKHTVASAKSATPTARPNQAEPVENMPP